MESITGFQRREVRVASLREAGLTQVASELMRCSARPIKNMPVILMLAADGKAHWSGLMHCGRHLCEICRPYQMAKRWTQLSRLADLNFDKGLHYLLTPTASHKPGLGWLECKYPIKKVARDIQDQRRWKTAVLGFFRIDETTWSPSSGHHFHQHYILTLRHETRIEDFEAFLMTYWAASMERFGGRCDWNAQKQEWWKPLKSPSDLKVAISYMTKGMDTQNFPPRSFEEIWYDSKRHRWSGEAGIWKPKKLDRAKNNKPNGQPVAWISPDAFESLGPAVWLKLRAATQGRFQDPQKLQETLAECSRALEGLLHVGQPPDVGKVAESPRDEGTCD